MSICVLDASYAFGWLFLDESSEEMDAALMQVRANGATLAALWFAEICNGLGMAERWARIDADGVAHALRIVEGLPLKRDDASNGHATAILTATRADKLTAYDATYLELACRTGLPLATKDRALQAAANAAGIPLLKG